MHLREVDFNAVPRKAPPPLATFVGPPRPPKASPRPPPEPPRASASRAECPCATCTQHRQHYARAKASPAAPQETYFNNPYGAAPLVYAGTRRAISFPAGGGDACATSVSSFDAAEEFERRCAGRVVELACTSAGRTMLQLAMRSQDAAVIGAILREIAADVENVALDCNGCHVVRALIDYINAEQTAMLVSSFNETLVLNLCTVSQHTRRVLQALFDHPLIDLQPIVDILATNAQYLAATQQGCISLMRVFEQCAPEQKGQLLMLLLPMFAHIALDPFGNYVVQCAIEHSDKTTAAQYTITCFTGELLNMSCNKFASNVVEKIIKACGDVPAVRRLLMDELIFNPAALLQMVQDSFGNFVVQSIIEHTLHPNELKRIFDRLRPALPSSPFAAKIEAKMRTKRPAAPNHQQDAGGRGGTMSVTHSKGRAPAHR